MAVTNPVTRVPTVAVRDRKKRNARSWFVVPGMAFFAVFLLFPLLAVVAIAFTHWSGFDLSQAKWTGAKNFAALSHDHIFKAAFWRTLIFVVMTTIALNIVGLGLAMLIHTRVRGHEFLRVAVFVPLGISPVITGVMWQIILGPTGFANKALSGLGIGPYPFLGHTWAFTTIIVVSIWEFSGYNALLYYAGLQSLPSERVEAALIDGAGMWSTIRYVIVPYLKPVIGVIVALNLIGGWKVFDIVYVLTGGGPSNSTQVMSTYLYQQAFSFNDVGTASSIAIVIMAFALISVMIQRRLSRDAAT